MENLVRFFLCWIAIPADMRNPRVANNARVSLSAHLRWGIQRANLPGGMSAEVGKLQRTGGRYRRTKTAAKQYLNLCHDTGVSCHSRIRCTPLFL